MDAFYPVIAQVIVLLIAAWVAFALFGGVWRRYEKARVVIFEHEAGVKYVRGKLESVLGPGRYNTWPAPVEITRVDLREQSLSVPGQEMLTADKISTRASLILTYKIADPRLYLVKASVPYSQLYQSAQVSLRERIAARSLDDLLTDRGAVTEGLAESLDAEARTMGLAVTSARLLDLTLSGPAKQAFADIWKAQKEGVAALERARAEQASLRSLANAARLLKGNPELMNLRVLQALSGAPGKSAPTLVLGAAGGLLPVAQGERGGDDAIEPS